MTKKFFIAKKLILSSGRELEVSSEVEADNSISILVLLNHLDIVQEITKPISFRFEWQNQDNNINNICDPVVTIECRGGSPSGVRPVSESEIPIEGLNGFKDYLKMSEIQEIFKITQDIYLKLKSQ